MKIITVFFGAGGGGRTRTLLPGLDFESSTSANSITPANVNFMYAVQMVLVTGLEPVRYFYRGILSPLRLPISPHQHNTNILIDFLLIVKIYFNIIFIILSFTYFIFYIFIKFNNLKSRYKF